MYLNLLINVLLASLFNNKYKVLFYTDKNYFKFGDFQIQGSWLHLKKCVELLTRLLIFRTLLMRIQLSIKPQKIDFFISFTF